MRILGLSAFRHDTSAALLEDGRIVAAIEESKLARIHTRGLPEAAMKFCLERAGTTWRDLDAIAVATRPFQGWARRSWGALRTSVSSPIAAAYYEGNELGDLARDLGNLRALKQKKGSGPGQFLTFEHHLCHAASAFYLSPYDRALILTMDEDGDGRTAMLAVGEGTKIRTLESSAYPDSLALVYSRITELLGFVPHREEHKTQWLSLQGEPIFKPLFLKMLRGPRGVLPRLDSVFLEHGVTGRYTLSAKFYREIGLVNGKREFDDDLRRALANSLQSACIEIIGDLLDHYRKKEGVDHICLGGGMFQNVLLVSDLETKLGMGNIFVPPAPGNSGCAVGAAALAWQQGEGHPRHEPEPGNYWGPSYRVQAIKDVLDNSKARYTIPNTGERKIDSTIRLLQAGKIVGWFQGATEFGSRALGNRSLLASPWAEYVKENLNDYIKHRDWFRPFAISVPEEDCARYFDCSQLCRTMNSLGRVRAGVKTVPQDFCLPAQRIRLHMVNRNANPLFWNLLKAFGETAPAPMLLNTSFNIAGEPLVARPQDAVRSYFCSGVDALVIENFVLSKASPSPIVASGTGFAKQEKESEPAIATHF
jgi:carbamoyltransferase